MKLPPLAEIIDKLEKIPVTSWKGLNPGGGMMFYSPESKTDRIYPYQEAYCIDINGYEFGVFGGYEEDIYKIRISNHNDFCEWVKCKKKKKSFFESPESHLNNNKQYFRLKDLDKKLHNYAVQIKSKEDSVKSNALNDALNQPINGESDKSTTDIYLKALKED